jgi:hypothetical protein
MARRPPPASSGASEQSAGSADWVIAYTTGTGNPVPIGGRGSARRPVTMMPSTRRASSVRM